MGQCYPCAIARNRLHYGQLMVSSDELYAQGLLAFTCPGGALPPVPCPVHEAALIDPVNGTATTCDCMNGYYRNNNTGGCVTCEAGSYCTVAGKMKRCEDDHYSIAGASACTPCARTVSICPENQALTRCMEGNQKQDSRCVDCNSCQQLSSSPGALPCYRLSSNATG
jgi:hypothetical protein